jgi:hypothetical protein
MQTILLSREDVALRAQSLYESQIRAVVESPETVGKMVIIDIETGEYAIGENDLEAVRSLRQTNPTARLFGIRIGYDVAVSLGGVMERVTK